MKTDTKSVSAAGLVFAGVSSALAAEGPETESKTLDTAFEALKTFDWGTGITIPSEGKPPEDAELLKPIDEAVVAAHGDADAEKALADRLAAVLASEATRAAKDYVLRTLRTIGTAASVPAIAACLTDKDLSHMARYALESNSAPEAAAALREALSKAETPQKIGIIGSLGKRRDAASVDLIAPLLADGDEQIAAAAAAGLGAIGVSAAAKSLGECLEKATSALKSAVSDACLICAERLIADGKKAEAIALYKALGGSDQPKHVRMAATRGLLMAAGKKE